MYLSRGFQVRRFTKREISARRNAISLVCTGGDDGRYGWLGLLAPNFRHRRHLQF